jgi:uncharacterized protein YdiU (UPF0061 family)
MAQNFIQQFLEQTMQKAGFTDLSPEFSKAYQEKLELLLAKKIGIEATAFLSDAAIEELTKIMAEKPKTGPAKLFDFYSQNIPNFVDKMASIFKDFQDNYIATMAQINK